jgi:hypothetical protein
MDANAEPHLLTRRPIRILLGNSVLNRDGTLHGIHSAGEISDETIACRVEDPTPMRSNQAVDVAPVGRERAKGADLISAHEGAVARDISGENRGELPFDGIRFHA